MTLDIESLTLGQIRAIQALAFGVPAAASPPPILASPYHVGDSVFVRTVTYHYTGRISAIYPGEIVLADAAWIADSGRFHVALATGTLSEVEPYPERGGNGSVILNRGAIVDVSPWTHPLPRVPK
jgi:hypothetical protein